LEKAGEWLWNQEIYRCSDISAKW